MNYKSTSPRGDKWSDIRKEIFTQEEIADSDLRVAIISEIIKLRHQKHATQQQIEAATGIKQPVIARMEKGTTDPRLTTVLKILHSMGKTLTITDLATK